MERYIGIVAYAIMEPRNHILRIIFLATWQLSREAAFSISFSGSFQWKSESRFATRSIVEDSRFRGTDEKEAMNSVIGQQTASPTSSPSWLPLCLSLVPSLDLLLRVSLPFLLSLCLLLFPITRHTRAYVHYTRGNAASKDAWPWTSRCFFGVSRTEIGKNHADCVTLPCDFLWPLLERKAINWILSES